MASSDPERLSALTKASKHLFDNSEFSDLTVHIGDSWWFCHRAIVCTRCPSLKSEVVQKGSRYELGFGDEEADAAIQMLNYLYSFEKPSFEPDITVGKASPTLRWEMAVDLFELAHRYDLEPLADMARKELLRLAPDLCARWDQLNANEKEQRFQIIAEVWRKYPPGHKLGILRNSIIRGLVNVAEKVHGYHGMIDMLNMQSSFKYDFVSALYRTWPKEKARRMVTERASS